jgi:hypothetical protein
VANETGMKAPTLFMTMYVQAAPLDAVLTSTRRSGYIGRFCHHRMRTMQDPANGFRRIPLLGSRVNKLAYGRQAGKASYAESSVSFVRTEPSEFMT